MAKFQPELETCPICGSTCNCHIHDYYGRSIIDFRNDKRQKSDLCVMRVFCDSCEHAHAILPDDMDSAFILFENQKFPIRRTNRNENCHTKCSNPAIDYSKIGGNA